MFEMCTSTIGQRNTLSASRIGIEVKLWPAGLITMPEAPWMASWIQSTSVASLLDCRNSRVIPSAVARSRQSASTSASVALP
jgi:hypothetical protein